MKTPMLWYFLRLFVSLYAKIIASTIVTWISSWHVSSSLLRYCAVFLAPVWEPMHRIMRSTVDRRTKNKSSSVTDGWSMWPKNREPSLGRFFERCRHLIVLFPPDLLAYCLLMVGTPQVIMAGGQKVNGLTIYYISHCHLVVVVSKVWRLRLRVFTMSLRWDGFFVSDTILSIFIRTGNYIL